MTDFTDADLSDLLDAATPAPDPQTPTPKPVPAPPRERKRRAPQPAAEEKEPGDPDPDDDATARLARIAGLKSKLKAYQSHARFGPMLKEAGFDFAAALRKKKPGELKRELARADKLLSSKGGSDPADFIVKGVLSTAEAVGPKFGYNLEGLTMACYSDPEWLFTFERVKMKYGISALTGGLDPLVSLVSATGSSAFGLHMRNSSLKEMAPTIAKLDQPMPGAPAVGPAAPTGAAQEGPFPGASAPGLLTADGRPLQPQ